MVYEGIGRAAAGVVYQGIGKAAAGVVHESIGKTVFDTLFTVGMNDLVPRDTCPFK